MPLGGDVKADVPLLEVDGLCTWFQVRRGLLGRTRGVVRAVDEVSFQVAAGETLGLVGESGCGKTTLARTLVGLEQPVAGKILFRGEPLPDRRLRSRYIQIVFQDPYASLNPRRTVLQTLTEGLEEHGLLEGKPAEVAARLLEEVGLPAEAMHRYPFEFSGGQRQRIGLARALSLHPALVICDEPVSSLDVSVQAQVINLLLDLKARHGLAYLFISHDLSVVRHLSDRVAVMYLGRLVEVGPVEHVLGAPLHPYTQALLAAVPKVGVRGERKLVLPGEPPSAMNPPTGCHFHPRCPFAMDICREVYPAEMVKDDRIVRCHLYRSAERAQAPMENMDSRSCREKT